MIVPQALKQTSIHNFVTLSSFNENLDKFSIVDDGRKPAWSGYSLQTRINTSL